MHLIHKLPLRKLSFLTDTRINQIRYLSNLRINDHINGFTIEKIERIPDFNLNTVYMRHKISNAQLLHIDRIDTNCAFSIVFPTIPMNDKGTPHILEHMVLCGSREYPCRDPFFKMLTRSVANFMNAMTFPQYTMFTFSTENHKDYTNLMNVYFDAVFNPILNYYDFLQEAWRLSKQSENNKNVSIHGVVYNEMKGVYSDSLQLFYRHCLKAMYGYGDSGGHPSEIVNLSIEELRKFHKENYHLSKSRFVTYGSLQLNDMLNNLNNLITSECKNSLIQVSDNINWPKIYPSIEANVDIECAKDMLSYDSERPFVFCRSFDVGRQSDTWTIFLLQMLDLLLFHCESSFLYQRLIASGLASSFLSQSGYDDNTINSSFHIGLQGVADIAQIQKALDESLDETIKYGFNNEDIQSALHKIELSALHVSSSFATDISIGVVAPWLYGLSIEDTLGISRKVKMFEDALKTNPNLLVDFLNEKIMVNSRRKDIVMRPTDSYSKRMKENEIHLANQKVLDIGLHGLDRMQTDISKMKSYQCEMEDVNCLPKLEISDISTDAKGYVYHPKKFADTVSGFVFPQQTNRLIYLRHLSSFEVKDDTLLFFLPLLTDIYSRLGTVKLPYWKLSRVISGVSSGIDMIPHVSVHPEDTNKFEIGAQISSFFLANNMDKTLDLWNEIFNDFRNVLHRDNGRLKVLIREAAIAAVNDLTSSGHVYAKLRAKSNTGHFISSINDIIFGLRQIEFLQNLRNSEEISNVINSVSELYDQLFSGVHRISVHHDLQDIPNLESISQKWANVLHISPITHENSPFWKLMPDNQSSSKSLDDIESYHIEAEVNYCATAIKLNSTNISIADKAALQVAASLITTKYLLPEIREKNGAYGSNASFSDDGFFCLTSYRDPRTIETVKDFRRIMDNFYKSDNPINDEDLRNAKIKTIQAIDKPKSVSNIGMPLFVRGITSEMQNLYRKAVLSIKIEDLMECMHRQLSGAFYSSCIIGSDNKNNVDNKKNM